LSPIGNKKLAIAIGAIIAPLHRRTHFLPATRFQSPKPVLFAGRRLPANRQIAL
jgi:hypothetical protein